MKCIKDLHLEMFLSFNLKVANDNTVLIDSCRLFHNLGLLVLSKPQLLTCYYTVEPNSNQWPHFQEVAVLAHI